MITLNLDIYAEIFKFVQANADVISIAQACRTLNPLATRELCRRQLSIEDEKQLLSFHKFIINHIGTHAHLLRRLDVYPDLYRGFEDIEVWIDPLVDILTHCSRLQDLEVGRARWLDMDPRVGSAICQLTDLRSLGICEADGVRNRDPMLAELCPPNLVSLYISCDSRADDYDPKDLESSLEFDKHDPNVLRSCASTLQTLCLELATIPDLTPHTLRFHNVTTLALRSCKFSGAAVIMHAFPNLRNLEISGDWRSSDVSPSEDSVLIEPWEKLYSLEASAKHAVFLGLPCKVRHWTLAGPLRLFDKAMDFLESSETHLLVMHMDLASKEDLQRMVDNASRFHMTHLILGLNVRSVPLEQIALLPDLVIQCAGNLRLLYLELKMYDFVDYEVLSAEQADSPRHASFCEELARLDHAAIASHAFSSVPSLICLGLSLHSNDEAEAWMKDIELESLVGEIHFQASQFDDGDARVEARLSPVTKDLCSDLEDGCSDSDSDSEGGSVGTGRSVEPWETNPQGALDDVPVIRISQTELDFVRQLEGLEPLKPRSKSEVPDL